MHGINIGDNKKKSFQVGLRTDGYGDPWDWIMEESQDYATAAGHGTCVAGIACAIADDDLLDLIAGEPTDVLGVAPGAKYFPIAMKWKGGAITSGTITNAFSKLGGLKGIFPEDMMVFEVSDT